MLGGMVARGSWWVTIGLALAGSGCLAVMVPERRTTGQVVSLERSPLIVGAAGAIVVTAVATGARIDVRTQRHRDCHRTTARVLEHRSKRVAKLSSSVVDLNGATGPGILVWMAAMPVVFAVSGLVTSVVVAVDGTEVARSRQQGDERFACPAQAIGIRIEATLPTGALLTGTSDALGRWTFMIPMAEPGDGDVTVRAVDVPEPPPPPPPDPDLLTDPAPRQPPAIPVVTVRYTSG